MVYGLGKTVSRSTRHQYVVCGRGRRLAVSGAGDMRYLRESRGRVQIVAVVLRPEPRKTVKMLLTHKIMFLESSLYTGVMVVAAVLAGLVAGGLAFTIAWRMVRGQRIIGAAHCPSCGHPLTLRDQIPLVSWVMQRGTCAYCGEPISMAYPASELIGAGIFSSVILRHGISLVTVEVLALACVLMVCAMNSVMNYRIPNGCIACAVLIRAAYLLALHLQGGDAVNLAITSAVGAAALGIPLFCAVWLANAMLARDVTGMGTVKLVAVVGLYLGWQQGLICLVGAAALGFLVWVVSPAKVLPVEVEGGPHDASATGEQPLTPRDLRATREEDIAEPIRLIPFAPSIIIACWVMLLLGVTPALWNTPVI